MDDGVSGAAIFRACYVELPTISGDGRTVTAQLIFPDDFAAFAGHFPEDPILPGFLQIELALDMLRRLKMAAELKSVGRTRFFLPIRPGRRVYASLVAQASVGFHLELKVDREVATVMEIAVG